MKRRTLLAALASIPALGARAQSAPAGPWKASPESESLVPDAKLRAQMFRALDAAKNAGIDPSISGFPVRAATVFELNGVEHTVVGGNCEYAIPEAIHGETSMLNHVTALFGPQVTRKNVRFVAYYGHSYISSCGDCRDYQLAATDYENLLVVAGKEPEYIAGITRFTDQIVPEKNFPLAGAPKIPLAEKDLDSLVASAQEAREGGINLFTSAARHTGAAGISFAGKTYRSAGADDPAFHYRYPIGGLLQQAAAERDYYFRAVVVVGEKGQWPVVSYRDRQYGFDSDIFNHAAGKPSMLLIITDGLGNFRMTTFEDALPPASKPADFMSKALTNFLDSHQKKD